MLSDHFSFMEDSWLVLQRNRLLINVLLVSLINHVCICILFLACAINK